MADENVEAVRGVFARWEQGRMEAGVELFDPEIHFESFMPDANERIRATGPEEVGDFMREFLDQWSDYKLLGDEYTAIGEDRVFVKGRQNGTGALSGVTVEDTIYSIWTFREGRITGLIFEVDRAKALEAAGLEE